MTFVTVVLCNPDFVGSKIFYLSDYIMNIYYARLRLKI